MMQVELSNESGAGRGRLEREGGIMPRTRSVDLATEAKREGGERVIDETFSLF